THRLSHALSSTATSTPEFFTLSLHDALPIFAPLLLARVAARENAGHVVEHVGRAFLVVAVIANQTSFHHVDLLLRLGIHDVRHRSEEHTSELQSRENLVCRLLLEKKNRS